MNILIIIALVIISLCMCGCIYSNNSISTREYEEDFKEFCDSLENGNK